VVIDSHHHFWHYNTDEFGWIYDEMSVIRRDFLPEDLRRSATEAGVDGVVSVQARQTLEETNWLLELAEQNADFIRGVVGWVPLISADVGGQLRQLASTHPKLKGVRHVLQGEADDRYMLRDDFNRGVSHLAALNLAYDILIFERHLPQTIEFVDRHSADQRFIVDHIAKPRIKSNELEPWRTNIRELARRPNVFCKVSGMVTEADFRAWTPQELRPYFDAVLEAFGPRRLMFGSDWPVCLVACGYARWRDVVETFAEGLTKDEKAQLFGETAKRAYLI
jgi:L-fuconolactonase